MLDVRQTVVTGSCIGEFPCESLEEAGEKTEKFKARMSGILEACGEPAEQCVSCVAC